MTDQQAYTPQERVEEEDPDEVQDLDQPGSTPQGRTDQADDEDQPPRD